MKKERRKFGTLKVVESTSGMKKGYFLATVIGEENIRIVRELAKDRKLWETTIGSQLLNEIIQQHKTN